MSNANAGFHRQKVKIMKVTLLQFDSLAELAAFWKQVNNRGYLIIVKDLTLRCALTNEELSVALSVYHAKQLPPDDTFGAT